MNDPTPGPGHAHEPVPEPSHDPTPVPEPNYEPVPEPVVAVVPETSYWPTPVPEASDQPAPGYGPTPSHAPVPKPEPVLVQPDRLAVAIGNASLLGIGYLLLGKRAWAIVTGLVTIALLALVGASAPAVGLVFVAWWVGLIAHGWHLARRPAPARAGRPRLLALVMVVPVLAFIVYARVDATGIEGNIVAARENGDCEKARSSLNRIWFGHNLVHRPMTVRSNQTAEACDRLHTASQKLQRAAENRSGTELQASYDALGAVLTELPGHDKMVGTVLDGFLNSIKGRPACDAAELTDWLRQRKKSDNLLDRSADVVPQVAPAALVGCADLRMADRNWELAKARYQQAVDLYPDHELAAKAREGLVKATQAAELAHLTNLGRGYCTKPAIYSAATPWVKGATNRAVIYQTESGVDPHLLKIPAEWQTDVAGAAMIVCVGKQAHGTRVASCPYVREKDGKARTATFDKIAYPVRAYELRGGTLVADTMVEIGGVSCPSRITGLGDDDPLDKLVEPSEADIRAAFARIFS